MVEYKHTSWSKKISGWLVAIVSLLLIQVPVVFGQAAADTTAVEQRSVSTADEGELIELESVQIEGEIAQPHVSITVSRQEPRFREISLRRTPADGVLGMEYTEESILTSEATKIKNLSQMLNRPRQ